MAEEIEIRLPDLSRVALEPGDKLLVRTPRSVDMSSARAIKERLQHHFPGHDVVVLSDGLELSVVRPRDNVPTTPDAPTPEEIARRFAEVNDRPQHMGPA